MIVSNHRQLQKRALSLLFHRMSLSQVRLQGRVLYLPRKGNLRRSAFLCPGCGIFSRRMTG